MKQGLLGDCWLLCACAALQKSQYLLDQVSGGAAFLSAPHRKEARGRAAAAPALWVVLQLPGVAAGKRELCSGPQGLRGADAVRGSPGLQCPCFLLCSALLSPGFWCRWSIWEAKRSAPA